MTSVVGVDVGGTKIAAVRIDAGSLSVQAQTIIPTSPTRSADLVLHDCARIVSTIAARDTAGVALGVCELVSIDGSIESRHTIDWVGVDLAPSFAPLPLLSVESDVRAAARAEARLTSAALLPSFLYVVVGTGLSSAWVVQGEPWSGTHGHAILLGGNELESRASGGGLQRLLGIDDLADMPDLTTHPLVIEGAQLLGRELALLVNALDPAAVLFGGGLGLNGAFRALVESSLRSGIASNAVRQVPVRAAELAHLGGAVGAALVGLERLTGSDG